MNAILWLLLLPVLAWSMIDRGIIYLDDLTYKKVIDGSRDVLVRFEKDHVNAYHHEEFEEVAVRVGESQQPMLVATIPVAKREVDPKNVDISARYGADDESQYPAYVLFKRGTDWRGTPLRYPDEAPKKATDLLLWCSRHTGAFFGSQGQLHGLERLAHVMMLAADEEERSVIAARAQQLANQVEERELAEVVQYYKQVFAEAAEDPSFPESESKRLSGLVSGQVSDKQRAALQVKLHVLKSFGVHKPRGVPRQEL